MTLADRIASLPGWHVTTAIETSIGPVALTAIGPGGAYVVETAVAPGAHHPADVPERALIHASALARHLAAFVGRRFTPILAVGADLDGLGGRRRGVEVLPAELAPNWLAERPPVLIPAAVDALAARAHALAAPRVSRAGRLQRGSDGAEPAVPAAPDLHS